MLVAAEGMQASRVVLAAVQVEGEPAHLEALANHLRRQTPHASLTHVNTCPLLDDDILSLASSLHESSLPFRPRLHRLHESSLRFEPIS